MKYLKALLLGVILTLSASALYLHTSLQEAREELAGTTLQLESLSASLGALQGRVERIQAGVQAVESNRGKIDAEISRELAEVPEWADAPVPAGVRDGLCSFLSCSD